MNVLSEPRAFGDKALYNRLNRSPLFRGGDIEQTFEKFRTADGRTSYDYLIAAAPQLSGAAVLDLAGGSGPIAKRCLDRIGPEGRVFLVDFSPMELDLAQQRINDPRMTCLCEPAQRLSIPDNSIDAVFCHLAIMLFLPLDPVIGEVRRILKPGGSFVFNTLAVPPDKLSLEYDRLAESHAERLSPGKPHAWGDPRAAQPETLSEYFLAAGGFSAPVFDDYQVGWRSTPAEMCAELKTFFQVGYLLDCAGYQTLQAEMLELLSRYAEPGPSVAFQLGFARGAALKC